ncbi:HNH endonuclease signature motif containing protein [Oleiagrimonas sp. C23AA]|uniref:HNH endonuclease n=1 Tax=Oleiagrimonas sp. C23AA TaxID=2719047 RepID=UPI0014218F2F|nr:HNH endonuclease signature motif containing protein [Oleiagrimonas sp. C23AA]NII11738.1 HNH endonuclease [Oleiagrimonas sp. C23AA]
MNIDLEDIRPTTHQRVMDLVADAGIDVSDWGNYKRGPDHAASNPKYCYEWAFVEPEQRVVLCLWFDHMLEEEGYVRQRHNFRRFAMELERISGKGTWAKRARALDTAIQDAARDKLPLRVIICEGEIRDVEEEGSEASRVHRRLLDPQPWAVTAYDWMTGDAVLTRSASPNAFADQFTLAEERSASAQRVAVSGEKFVRDPGIRAAALARAQGQCEFCGERGFSMSDGRTYLETHHIIPLSEDGPDATENVIALCANHHREAHYGIGRQKMRETLQAKLRNRS